MRIPSSKRLEIVKLQNVKTSLFSYCSCIAAFCCIINEIYMIFCNNDCPQVAAVEGGGEADQLEGESFQPAYTPYAAPPQAYDTPSYIPVEQRGIESAVAAGAAGYQAVRR